MTDSPVDMYVPSFGHGLGEALLIEWVAAVGDLVERGDVIAVVETDKASTEIVAEVPGRVTAHSATVGTVLKSGEPLYRLAAGQPGPA
ncbi:lipoyl domain-containing protein [Streptomyces sp. XY006]|uniref:lipoyl domain-containing protein n=1 Tax=Streptomyces sp. XY006 TaxID=2021410 RepID=UPI00211AFFEF|nr:lipoyl domain-containing protein [Streptomyces sp. XY006]